MKCYMPLHFNFSLSERYFIISHQILTYRPSLSLLMSSLVCFKYPWMRIVMLAFLYPLFSGNNTSGRLFQRHRLSQADSQKKQKSEKRAGKTSGDSLLIYNFWAHWGKSDWFIADKGNIWPFYFIFFFFHF